MNPVIPLGLYSQCPSTFPFTLSMLHSSFTPSQRWCHISDVWTRWTLCTLRLLQTWEACQTEGLLPAQCSWECTVSAYTNLHRTAHTWPCMSLPPNQQGGRIFAANICTWHCTKCSTRTPSSPKACKISISWAGKSMQVWSVRTRDEVQVLPFPLYIWE